MTKSWLRQTFFPEVMRDDKVLELVGRLVFIGDGMGDMRGELGHHTNRIWLINCETRNVWTPANYCRHTSIEFP
ncbi:hypothetical protein D4T97_010785 [Siminovitchia acidinfaciens]|uniref:Uncharacterized protein n=1 Tax=Siminovitchia acidinfaciens TaxID=2321395 RepID=A0A429XZE5_9BACI|nr:hypothetical protein D4T97_010785 [Siminovitchia acidinfaciens]